MQYFSKRKPKSNWSKVNKEKIDQLIQNNQMTKAGLESVEIAKQNGSWVLLDDIENLVVPADLEKALKDTSNAMSFFESLSKSNKKILLYWVMSAKRIETRNNRIEEIVRSAAINMKPKQFK